MHISSFMLFFPHQLYNFARLVTPTAWIMCVFLFVSSACRADYRLNYYLHSLVVSEKHLYISALIFICRRTSLVIGRIVIESGCVMFFFISVPLFWQRQWDVRRIWGGGEKKIWIVNCCAHVFSWPSDVFLWVSVIMDKYTLNIPRARE